LQERTRRIIAEAVVGALGVGLMAAAALATQAWFERHFLPEFLHPRPGQLRAYMAVRIAVALLGLALALLVRPRAGQIAARHSFGRLALTAAPSLVAVAAAVVAAELVLDSMAWRSREQSPPMYEPRRVWDTTFGWRQLADRTGYGVTGGRQVEYAFDVHGYRVRRQDQPVDLSRPTIVVVGESFIQGHGLSYGETMPAQLSALTGVQTANVAVGGYATDQVYMLLRAELPRFQRPVAVVTIFMPGLFHRNLDTDRPHLGPGLAWRPPTRQPRLAEIFGRLVQYRSDRRIAEGVAETQAQLRAMQALAQARGADFVILTPQVGPESAEERGIRRRVLDAAGLPYVVAPMPAAWLLPHNRHPDARGAQVMAAAVAAYLRDHETHRLARTAASAAHPQG
jgi:hypothetical protein